MFTIGAVVTAVQRMIQPAVVVPSVAKTVTLVKYIPEGVHNTMLFTAGLAHDDPKNGAWMDGNCRAACWSSPPLDTRSCMRACQDAVRVS